MIKRKTNQGFTYVELIVVLSIFAMMTSLVLFNYSAFQNKVDINVLTSDIALKIVQAQKDAMSGKWNDSVSDPEWKPSYGVSFKLGEYFVYFIDSNNENSFDYWSSFCPSAGSDECLDNIHITKNNKIAKLKAFNSSNTQINETEISIGGLSINFTRPNSSAIFYAGDTKLDDVFCAEIDVSTSGSNPAQSSIKVYSSGRIQLGECVVQ